MRTGNKKGYVLLTVVCVFAFLSALGFTLLTAALANMQSAERKLASARTDAYAVSLAESSTTWWRRGGSSRSYRGGNRPPRLPPASPTAGIRSFCRGEARQNALGIGEDRRRGPGRPRRGRRDGPYGRLLLPFGRHRPPGPRRPRTTAANIPPPERSRPIWPSPASSTAGRWSSGSTAPSTRAADAGKWKLRQFVKGD